MRTPPRRPIPDNIAAQEHTVRDSLVEGIVVADDDLMARYLDGEEITADELSKTLARGVVSSQVFPVICGSATKLVGIDRLLDIICDVAPSPLERPPALVRPAAPAPGGEAVEVAATRPASRWLGSSRRSPTPTSGKYRCSRSCPARSAPTPSCSTRGRGPKSASTLSSPCGARSRSR